MSYASATPSAADVAIVRAGARLLLNRREEAADNFRALMVEVGLTKSEAEAAFAFYVKNKLVKFDGMRWVVKHGAFWELDVMQRAVAAAMA